MKNATFGDNAQLKQFVERIERAENDKKEAATFVSGVYAEAKASGFDAKTLRKVVRLRMQDAKKRQEEEELLDIYKHALGMI